MNVNLIIRYEGEAEGTCVGYGDPEDFLVSLNHYGYYVEGVTPADGSLEAQWTPQGFEAIFLDD